MTPGMILPLVVSGVAFLVGLLLLLLRRPGWPSPSGLLAQAICLALAGLFRLLLTLPLLSWLALTLEVVLSGLLLVLPALILFQALGLSTSQKRSLLPGLLLLVFFPALLTGGLTFRLFSASPSAVAGLGSLVLTSTQAWGLLVPVYSFGLLVAALLLFLSRSWVTLKPLRAGGFSLVSVALGLALLLLLAPSLGWPPSIASLDLVLAAQFFIGLAILVAVRWFPLPPLFSRGDLFHSIQDGIIILDGDDRILDMNPAAEELVGIPIQRLTGDHIEKILTNWSSISGSNVVHDREVNGSLNLNNRWRYFSVRINRLETGGGKVILLRDITDRRESSQVRQAARDEMFGMLRTFFDSANTAQSFSDFLRDVLYQVVYTFHADNGAICLLEPLSSGRKPKVSLMARHGPLTADLEVVTSLHKIVQASRWLQGDRAPLIIPSEGQDPRLEAISRSFGRHSFAAFPLLFNEQLLGALMLARTEAPDFLADEVYRLGVLTEELSSFIIADRNRKADIALSERLHLSQGLHDSILQDLAATLQWTQVIKMSMETGRPVEMDTVETVIMIARQAIREMRLFIFGLSPVDLEHDGLVSALQQRLAEVEGRAGIQPRMFADGEFSLSPEEETEIYYIVEEALNNILKHANARSVTIKLKPRKASVYLEIVDDGCGFDPAGVEAGHRGLKNIRERAARLKGRLKIDSSPQTGTKITLVIPQ